VRIEQGDGTDDADSRPRSADAGPQPSPASGDRSTPPKDSAVYAERTVAYRHEAQAVYRAYAIDQGCAEVEKIETDTVTPAMLRIEAEDPTRRLAGFENRLKEKDRLSQKIARSVDERGRTVDEAFSLVKDAIRYTFCYPDDLYTQGVHTDWERIKEEGFEPVERENSWTGEQYKGINSRWRVPENTQLFEVQFHTEASYQAKEETHPAYEKLRVGVPTRAEQLELEEFQKQVTARVPIPPGAAEIPNYP